MPRYKNIVPEGFARPTQAPKNDSQAEDWQSANRTWWEEHPMRYDWQDDVGETEFSPGFYREIDSRFFNDARSYLPWEDKPFERLIDYASISEKDVLEIGVGNGSHAQLLASHARSFKGIDLTDYAVRSTSTRLKVFGVAGEVYKMDAEKLAFPDHSFDFIWSWGVIHHSSDTRSVLKEIHRVLRPGGTVVTMVYYRSWWTYYLVGTILYGILQRRLFSSGSIHEAIQKSVDGALARYYSMEEWKCELLPDFKLTRMQIMGSKTGVVPLPAGRIKNVVMGLIPDACTRFLTNTCRMGGMLVSEFSK